MRWHSLKSGTANCRGSGAHWAPGVELHYGVYETGTKSPTSLNTFTQENLANAKVSARQQCMYEGP